MAKITFLGAAGTVTGSKYLIEAAGKRLLVDCGLFQGSKELQQRNWNQLKVDPATIDWVLLTHAHIDHTGYLPRLVAAGYRGPDLCRCRHARAVQPAAARFRAPAGRGRPIRRAPRLQQPQTAATALHRGAGAAGLGALPGNSHAKVISRSARNFPCARTMPGTSWAPRGWN